MLRGILFLFSASALLVSAPADRTLVRVSGPSPFAASCNQGQAGVNYRNAEVEPWVIADPTNPKHLIGVWQQDRWSNGGASGLLTGISNDGGRSWSISSARFSRCAGGDYDRATDPWVTISPNGVVHQISYSFNRSNANQAILVSRSADGGLNWSDPVAVITDTDPNVADDKESITADPNDANFVYAVWDRLSGLNSTKSFRGPSWFARTIDGGRTWEQARIIYDPGPNAQTIGNQIVVLPDGTLIDFLNWIQNASATVVQDEKNFLAVLRSEDKGVTWSQPIVIAADQAIGVADVKTGTLLRTGTDIAAIAVDHDSGALYVTWEDARFSGSAREGIAFSKSMDGGLTWSTPEQVNQVPDVQAFESAISVGANGLIGITYYDFRKDTADAAALLTNIWLITSKDGGASWHESPVAGPFDLLDAPLAGNSLFLGDYQALIPSGDTFLSFFVATNSGDTENSTDVFATTGACAGDLTTNGHKEVNTFALPSRRLWNTMHTTPIRIPRPPGPTRRCPPLP